MKNGIKTKCSQCGKRHNSQWVCLLKDLDVKSVEPVRPTLTPVALKLIGHLKEAFKLKILNKVLDAPARNP